MGHGGVGMGKLASTASTPTRQSGSSTPKRLCKRWVLRRELAGRAAGKGYWSVAIGSMRWAVDPHCFVHCTADHVFMFSAMPVGPNETHVTGKWYVHKDAVEGVDYDVEKLIALWTMTNLEDKMLAENNQLGVNSPGYTPGPYSQEAEMLALRFTDYYCDKARDYIATHGKG